MDRLPDFQGLPDIIFMYCGSFTSSYVHESPFSLFYTGCYFVHSGKRLFRAGTNPCSEPVYVSSNGIIPGRIATISANRSLVSGFTSHREHIPVQGILDAQCLFVWRQVPAHGRCPAPEGSGGEYCQHRADCKDKFAG